jgi:hypothetical protein
VNRAGIAARGAFPPKIDRASSTVIGWEGTIDIPTEAIKEAENE